MGKSNAKKSEQLGMSHSTAAAQLRKHIMFQLVQQAGRDECFQCGEKINHVDNLSIEHKVPWLDSESPKEMFFDLNNIAFSHTKCNYGSARTKGVSKRRSLETIKIPKSGFLGVYKAERNKTKTWQAKIWLIDKTPSLGYYETAQEAAAVVDKALIEHYGEDVITNKSLGLL